MQVTYQALSAQGNQPALLFPVKCRVSHTRFRFPTGADFSCLKTAGASVSHIWGARHAFGLARRPINVLI